MREVIPGQVLSGEFAESYFAERRRLIRAAVIAQGTDSWGVKECRGSSFRPQRGGDAGRSSWRRFWS
jgi:hypothetical protein